MFRMLIKFICVKKSIINKILQESECLRPGRYSINNTLTYLYHKDAESNNKVHSLFGPSYISPIKRIVLYIIKICFFYKDIIVSHDNANEHFKGTVCSLGIFRESGKVFDYTNNKVLTLFLNEEEYVSTLENYNYFGRYFLMPEIQYQDKAHLLIIENLISVKPLSLWSKEDYKVVINDVFKRYSQYFQEVKNKNGYFRKAPAALYENNVITQVFKPVFADINQSLMKTELPFVRLHGDLWAPNLLISENRGIYYIDYEFSDHMIFFYDIFWLIIEQAFMNNNFEYVYDYLKGIYDKFFDSIFQLFQIEYNILFRLDYIKIFFLNYASKRWGYLNWWKKRINCFKYKRFIRALTKYAEVLSNK